MKPSYLLAAIILFLSISACKKIGGCDPGNMNGSMSLAGTWQVVRDSVSNSWLKTSAVNTTYVGVTGDYFDFRSDGFCYTKEGNVYDTLSYEQVSPKSVIMQNFGLVINGSTEASMVDETTDSATITTNNILSPGGTIFRTVNLKR